MVFGNKRNVKRQLFPPYAQLFQTTLPRHAASMKPFWLALAT
jgi:hypothetical protein